MSEARRQSSPNPKPSLVLQAPLNKKASLAPPIEANKETNLSVSNSLLHVAVSKRSQVSSTQSERIRRLLSLLENYDSLYICPIKTPLPPAILSQLHTRPVRQFEVRDYFGNICFYAAELTSCGWYYCCSNTRPFEIYMYTTDGSIIFESVRETNLTMAVCGVDCCISGGILTTANFRDREHFIGGVVSSCTCNGPTFIVQNRFWDDKFEIKGPRFSLWLPCRLCCLSDFKITLPQTNISVGKFIAGYDGLTEDLVPSKGTLGIIFPPRVTAEVKACLIAAGFMLEVTYFHNRGITCHRICRYLSYFMMLAGFGLLINYIVMYENLVKK